MVSTEDTSEIWETVREEAIEKVRGNKNRSVRVDSPMVDEVEVQKSFCLIRPDGWVINRKMKKITLPEFKRVSDSSESYYQDMWKVTEKQNTPILTGLRSLETDREWEVEVVPLVVGQRSVKEKEWLEPSSLGLGKKMGSPSSLFQLPGKDISVRVSHPPQGG